MREIDIPTQGGGINAWLFEPAGTPRCPVLFLMDAPGIRPALLSMCERLAAAGHRTLLPNLYWRAARDIGFDRARFERDETGEKTRVLNLARGVTNAMVAEDMPAVLDALGPGPVAAVGYCMSGRFALLAMLEHPGRVAAAASFYGTRLVMEAEGEASPHRRLAGLRQGDALVVFAEHDSYVPEGVHQAMRETLARTPVPHRVDVYPGTHHGFAFTDSKAHDAAAEARHWDALFDLLSRVKVG